MPDIIGLITGLFTGGNSIFVLLGGAFIASMVAWMRGRVTGAKAERNKVAADRLASRERADKIDNDIAATDPKDARKELGRWSKHFD